MATTLEHFKINTNSGMLDALSNERVSMFLTESEIDELNRIGYTGKNSDGEKSNFDKYLNSLGKGRFIVDQTKFDRGDYNESYLISRVYEIDSKEITYYLFSSDAVREYENGGINNLINEIQDNGTIFSTFEFIEGETKSGELLAAIDGWNDYCTITKEEYEQLLEI